MCLTLVAAGTYLCEPQHTASTEDDQVFLTLSPFPPVTQANGNLRTPMAAIPCMELSTDKTGERASLSLGGHCVYFRSHSAGFNNTNAMLLQAC